VGGAGVTVPAGATISGVDQQLTLGSGLTGRIVDAAGNRPLRAAQVLVFDGNGAYVTGDDADGAGHYRLTRLPAGSYRVCFFAAAYRPQCYAGVPWSLDDVPAGAKIVSTRPGALTQLADARLRRA
jgi:hypothetical protein